MLIDLLKTVPQYILPKQMLTHYAGMLANVTTPFIKNYLIRRFINKYQVNMLEAVKERIEDYSSFNEFFIRKLKSTCRPIAEADLVSPVDGYVSMHGPIQQGQIIQAKGKNYTAKELLSCEDELILPFYQGSFSTFYLSPRDYHRVHMPIDASLRKIIYIPGKLFSVQPSSTRIIPYLFARNERLVAFFDTHVGLMAMVLVGATIVGSIETCWQVPGERGSEKQVFCFDSCPKIKKGEEMGYFKLGSTVILLFSQPAAFQWLRELKAGEKLSYGEELANIKTK